MGNLVERKKSRFQIEILLEIQVKTFEKEKEKKQVDIPVQNSGETWIELEI